MAFVMTYDNLITTAGDYLERPDLVSILPTLIRFAEKKVARILKAQLATVTVTNTLTANNPLVTKPERWIETVSFTVLSGTSVSVLKKRSRETIQTMFPDSSVVGLPKYYAEWEQNYFYVGQTPDAAYNFELVIYQEPVPLDANNQTNYLTEFAPDLLLYATLLEATGYLKNDERLQVWMAARDECIQQLTGLDVRRQSDRQQYRNKGA